MIRRILVMLLLCLLAAGVAAAAQDTAAARVAARINAGLAHSDSIATAPNVAGNTYTTTDVAVLVAQSLLAGLLAVFTPYVYTIQPFTSGYLVRNVKSKRRQIMNRLLYAFSLILIFTLLGGLISLLVKATKVERYTEHWLFNFFFFRIFVTLGISFLGAFALKLPAFIVNAVSRRAESNSPGGIFFMAVTLPVASFSSTFPIIGLVLLVAGKVSILGPTIGLFCFSVGLSLPFIFPNIMKAIIRSKSLLNNVKVVMGFVSLMIALKFIARADLSLGYHLIDREIYILVWLLLWAFMGIYMLGVIQLSHDTENEQNIYGQPYVKLSRLFIAIAAFTFALYLLPGLWGAPLPAVAGYLPTY